VTIEATPTESNTTAVNGGQLVVVSTDVLDVVIDLRGGDIVETSLKKFPENIDDPDTPLLLLEKNQLRTYVLQSGLVGPDGIDSPTRANYSAPQQRFEFSGTESGQVQLAAIGTPAGVTVTKTFGFSADSYVITIGYTIDNGSNLEWQAVPFAQFKRDNSQAPAADTSGFGMQPFLGAATTTADDRFKKFSFEDIAEDPWKLQQQGGWIAMLQHYFTAALIPDPQSTSTFNTRQTREGFNIAGLTGSPLTVPAGGKASWAIQFYGGPKDQYTLANLSPHLELVVDYGWLWWIAQPLFWLLTQIQALVVNWGVAIILLTLLIKAVFFQLSAASYRSMAKMRKVQPKMLAIREQHANDKQKQSQAMMELYKKEKINPMGGCLPILVQMPVFIALYWVLMESVELRQAPFALWIKDLSVMDPYFVLPILMGASMFFMQKLNPPPPDPMQAKLMQWLPVIFTFFFLWFPAGLVLYWVVNNLLSMAQQYVITRRIEREGA
jgi:YidC/Oxa1 family membrane protein insertase